MESTLKSIGKILLMVFLVIYLIIEIIVTICVLNFNDNRVTVFGDNSLVILKEDISSTYKKNDVVVAKKVDGSKVSEGDYIFYYNPSKNNQIEYKEVEDISDNGLAYSFRVENNYNVYQEYFIGVPDHVYHNVGGMLSLLESKWGFLLLIILPTMIAIVVELYAVIMEIIELKNEG